MKTVYMIVKGSGYNLTEEKAGRYTTKLYYYKGDEVISKILEGDDVNTTSGRMIVTGVIEGLKVLKEPCIVKIRTHNHFGYKKVKKAIKNKGIVRNSVNSDLLNILMEELEKGGHKLEVTITSVSI